MLIALHNTTWITYFDLKMIWLSTQNFFNHSVVDFLLKWYHDPTPNGGGGLPIQETSRSVTCIIHAHTYSTIGLCIYEIFMHVYIPHSSALLPEVLAPYFRSLFLMLMTTSTCICLYVCMGVHTCIYIYTQVLAFALAASKS